MLVKSPRILPARLLLRPGARGAGPRRELAAADVVIGRDNMTGRDFPLYGRDLAERIRATGRGQWARVLHVGLDQDTDELEQVLAVIEAIKGRHDYVGGV